MDTGGLARKDRITHKIELKSAEEIDDEVKKWLKTAYGIGCLRRKIQSAVCRRNGLGHAGRKAERLVVFAD
jgi:hypothetical protein